MHIHSIHATVLASLADSNLPAIDQNTAIFFDRYVIDNEYGGLAFEEEAQRCADLLCDPKKKVLIMGNHGIMVIGATAAETFNRMYYFELAAETYIRAFKPGSLCGCCLTRSPKKRRKKSKNTPIRTPAIWLN